VLEISTLPLTVDSASEVTTLRHYRNTFIIIIFTPVAYDPERFKKLDRLQNTTELAGMTCDLINKAVVKPNCIEAFNQHAQSLNKKKRKLLQVV